MMRYSDPVRKYRIRGFPFVAFFQNGKIAYSLLGLHPREKYIRAIDRLVPEND